MLQLICNGFDANFPIYIFSYEPRETFPFVYCFWWFISSGFESRCFDNSENPWNRWSWLLPDKRSCLLVCSTNMYEFSEEKQREMWMHWCFPLAFSPIFFENNIFQYQNCELWRGQKDWGVSIMRAKDKEIKMNWSDWKINRIYLILNHQALIL